MWSDQWQLQLPGNAAFLWANECASALSLSLSHWYYFCNFTLMSAIVAGNPRWESQLGKPQNIWKIPSSQVNLSCACVKPQPNMNKHKIIRSRHFVCNDHCHYKVWVEKKVTSRKLWIIIHLMKDWFIPNHLVSFSRLMTKWRRNRKELK